MCRDTGENRYNVNKIGGPGPADCFPSHGATGVSYCKHAGYTTLYTSYILSIFFFLYMLGMYPPGIVVTVL
jgi:hypothetical protein